MVKVIGVATLVLFVRCSGGCECESFAKVEEYLDVGALEYRLCLLGLVLFGVLLALSNWRRYRSFLHQQLSGFKFRFLNKIDR